MDNRMRKLRKKAGLTQAEAAQKVGIQKDQYGRIELGKSKGSRATLQKIAELFGTDVDYLTYNDEKSKELLALFKCFDDNEQDIILDQLKSTIKMLEKRENGF